MTRYAIVASAVSWHAAQLRSELVPSHAIHVVIDTARNHPAGLQRLGTGITTFKSAAAVGEDAARALPSKATTNVSFLSLQARCRLRWRKSSRQSALASLLSSNHVAKLKHCLGQVTTCRRESISRVARVG